MKNLQITILLLGIIQFGSAQIVYSPSNFTGYADWFISQSPQQNLFRRGAQLFIFMDQAPLRSSPYAAADVVELLPIGTSVENLSVSRSSLRPDVQQGYGDWWFRVKVCADAYGREREGYIWGGHLARSWQTAIVDERRPPQLVMLGLSTLPRHSESTILAEIRIVSDAGLLASASIPGLCVFRECESNTLVRVLRNHPRSGECMIEASTMVGGCEGGVEKAFYYWNGEGLERVYHAQYTVNLVYANQPFVTARNGERQECYYKGEDRHYNPVWVCRTVTDAPAAPTTITRAVP